MGQTHVSPACAQIAPNDVKEGAIGMANNGSASQYLAGDKLFQERARAALPILIRQASQSATVYYSDLAPELGM